MTYSGMLGTIKLGLALVGASVAATGSAQAAGAESTKELLKPREAAALVEPRAQGENNVIEAVEAVSTTASDASAALRFQSASEPNPGPEMPVVLVVLHGQFIANVPAPRGALPPTGTVMAFVMDAETGFVSELSVGDRSPVLQPLGMVEHLPVPLGEAALAKKTNAILAVEVVDGSTIDLRLRHMGTVRITLRRKGRRVLTTKADGIVLHLHSGTYQLSARLRESGSKRVIRCRSRSVRVKKHAVTEVRVDCPVSQH
jgi:hypothetical protein